MNLSKLTAFLHVFISSVCGARKRRTRAAMCSPEMLESRQVMTASMLGTVSPQGEWKLDTNGMPGHEIDRNYGLPEDQFVVGNWTGQGDQLGVARKRPDGFMHWYLNTDAAVSPVHEIDFLYGLAGDTAVVGDWNGNGTTDAGVVRKNPSGGLDWYLDLNRDPNAERVQAFGLHGDIPVVGDWDNNGTANVGVVRRTSTGFLEWHMDVTGDAWPEVSRIFGVAGDVPLVGDWDRNGRIDLGVARPPQAGGSEWQILRDTNGDPLPDLPVLSGGSSSAKPVVGNWRFSEVNVVDLNVSGGRAVQDGQNGSQTISFGTLVQGEPPRELTFQIWNSGTTALQLSSLTVPQGFIITDGLTGVIQPGQSDLVKIQLPSTTAKSFSGDVTFVTNDGNESPFNFAISGTVEPAAPKLELTGNGDLGQILLGTTGAALERIFTLKNSGNSPLDYSASINNSTFRIVSGQQGTIPRGGTATVKVQLNSVTVGTKSSTLTITSNAVNVSSPVVRTLSAVVVAPSPVLAVTGSGAFGEVGLNSTGAVQERIFTITNPGNAPLTFSASSNSAQFAVVGGQSGTVMPNGGMATVLVRMLTSTVGPKSGTLTIQSNATSAPTRQYALSGTVVQGTARIDVVGSVDFGEVALNATSGSADREIIVRNSGTAPLTYTATVSNSNFTIVSGAAVTVPANGGTARIVIRMRTATVGTKSATLTIHSNDNSRPSVPVSLTGTVVAVPSTATPEVAVSIGTKTLAPAEIGQLYFGSGTTAVRQQTFTIRNTGTGTLKITSPSVIGEYTFQNLPTSLAPGESRVVTVRMVATSTGTKLGQLTFSTNDSDEGRIRINLLGRMLPPITSVQGQATSPVNGIFTLYASGTQAIFLDPSYGNTPFNGRYDLTVGGNKSPFSSALTKLVIVSSVRPDVQNWTNVTVVWQSPAGTVVIPSVRSRLDLFGGL
jgi:hypothetical protein